MPLKSTERQALLRVANGRFDLLEKAVTQARDELRIAVSDRLQAEAEDRIRQAREGLAEIVARAEALTHEAGEYIARCERELGVTVGSYRPTRMKVGSGKYAEERLSFNAYRYPDPIKLVVKNEWTVVDLDKQIQDAVRRLDTEAGLGRYNVAKQRVEFEEKVLLGDVGSDDAKAFLAELPTVDALPDPSELAERVQLTRTASKTEAWD